MHGALRKHGSNDWQFSKEDERIATNIIHRQPDLIFIDSINQFDINNIHQVIDQTWPPTTRAVVCQSLKSLAKSEDYAYLDMTTLWMKYIRFSGVHLYHFSWDKVHANEYGDQILSRILMAS